MIANRFHVSAFHLNRVFREAQGTTVMHYVTDLRIKSAQRMLRETDDRVNDIAQLAGFASATSFSTVFRKNTGLTPNQYRRQHR
jgi:AraC family transcriptional regulator of adaptative response / methylphosphotriester-DNA alkyltransferase methyltransferase